MTLHLKRVKKGEVKKKGKLAIIQPSFQILWFIYIIKTIPLCREMAWLPFQKIEREDANKLR